MWHRCLPAEGADANLKSHPGRTWEGQTIEVGANWIEGTAPAQNPIWHIAQEIGLKGNFTNQEVTSEVNVTPIPPWV